MKTIISIVALLSLALSACSNKGDQGATGATGASGATGPAGKDKTAEYFILFSLSGSNNKNELKRPIKVAVGDKSLDLTNKDCVRIKEEQIKTLAISLPEAPAVAPGPQAPTQPAVTVCDNSNKIGGTGADKDELKTSDDCPLYEYTYIWHDPKGKGASVFVNQNVGDYAFANAEINSIQKAKCKTL